MTRRLIPKQSNFQKLKWNW